MCRKDKNTTRFVDSNQGRPLSAGRKRTGEEFARLVQILDTLRGEDGCAWDRKQDVRSITSYFLEEVYEAIDALERDSIRSVAEELGDVLLEVVFLARLFQEQEQFNMEDVLEGINQKMIKRHPHVFDSPEKKSPERVLEDWNRQKTKEKKRDSLYDGFARTGPSLLKAFQITQKASSVGFDWDNPGDAWAKVTEEADEVERAIERGEIRDISEELGDLLFAVVNVARLCRINPELALRSANHKFIHRFQFIERELKKRGRTAEQASLEEMDALWNQSKMKE